MKFTIINKFYLFISNRYEEKCERTLHPRYCPDLATWDAWKTAFAVASKK